MLLGNGSGKENEYYTIEFKYQREGEEAYLVASERVKAGGLIYDAPKAPLAAEPAGKVFGGWYANLTGEGGAEGFPYKAERNATLWGRYVDVYLVRYYADGGENPGPSDNIMRGYWSESVRADGKALELKAPEYWGKAWDFDGWYASASYAAGSKVNGIYRVTGPVDFYAKWTEQYSITYNVGGKGNPPATEYVRADAGAKEMPRPDYAAGDYIFECWLDGSGESIEAGAAYAVTGDMALSAKWSTTVYKVTFYGNGGTLGANLYGSGGDPWGGKGGGRQWVGASYIENSADGLGLVLAVRSDAAPIDLPIEPSRAGYRFEGWYETEGAGPEVGGKAGWSGQAEAVSQYYTYEEAGDASLSYSGQWTGVRVKGNVTLRARWTRLSAVTYVGFDGTVSGVAATVEHDPGKREITLRTAERPDERKEWEFDGWYTKSGANWGIRVGAAGAAFDVYGYINGLPASMSSDERHAVTLYAKWTQVYVIELNANGGSAPQSAVRARADAASAGLPRPTYAGRAFAGWYYGNPNEASNAPVGNESSTGALTVGIDWLAGHADVETGRVELKAKWLLAYEVRFEYEGGSSASAGGSSVWYVTELNAEIELFGPDDYEKGRYDFDGWYDKSDSTKKLYGASERYEVTRNVVFVAKLAKVWLATFYENGGGGEYTLRIRDGAGETELPVPAYAGADRRFDGWRANSGLSGAKLLTYEFKSDAAFYGKWVKLYVISFNLKGVGTLAAAPTGRITVDENSYLRDILSVYAPAAEGWSFDKWYRDEGLTQEAQGGYAVTGGMTLYAKWTRTYTVRYETFGIGSEIAAAAVRSDENVLTLPGAGGYAAGKYDFDGWYEDAAFGFGPYTKYTVTSDMTFYAKYTARYTVSFDSAGAQNYAPITRRADDAQVTLPTPSRGDAYIFEGWFEAAGAGAAYDNSSLNSGVYVIHKTTYLVALWAEVWTLRFETRGAAAIEPIKARSYDLPVELPTPEYAGYGFVGWYTDASATTPAVLNENGRYKILGNVTLYAKWSLATYTLTFVTNGGAYMSPLTVRSNDAAVDLSAGGSNAPSPRAGYVFIGWYADALFTGDALASLKVTGDASVYAKWIRYYTVTFETNGGASVAPRYAREDDAQITLPTPSERAGYDFDGWFKDGAFAVKAGDALAAYTVSADATLYAKWTRVYELTFVTNGGDALAARRVRADAGAITELPTAFRSGDWYFVGWYTDNALSAAVTLPTTVTSDKVLYAKWDTGYTVTFVNEFGTAPAAEQVRAGRSVTLITPVYDGTERRDFDGWYDSSAPATLYTGTYAPTKSVTLRAKWTRVYTVRFVTEIGTVTPEEVEVRAGEKATMPAVEAGAVAGRDFDGWYANAEYAGASYAPGQEVSITGDATFRAKWANLYTVAFVTQVGTLQSNSLTVREGSIALPAPEYAGAAYEFDGWYFNNEFTGVRASSPYNVRANVTLYAKWTEKYKVSFEANGGAATAAVTVRADNNVILLPTQAARAGYDFDGWFKDGAFAVKAGNALAAYTVTGNATLYAKWTAAYEVSFEVNGGTALAARRVRADDNVLTALVRPTREPASGWDFDGWFLNAQTNAAVTLPMTVTGNMTLYAKWTQVFTVTFNTGGGSAAAAARVRADDALTALPATTWSGYAFLGWYTDNITFLNKVTAPYAVTSNITLYAKWMPGLYIVTFETSGGASVPARSVSAEGESVELPAAARSGYEFEGWYTTAAYDAKVGNAGDAYAVNASVTLYAKWTAVYTVTFSLRVGSEAPRQIKSGGQLQLPSPSYGGYEFEGWYGDSGYQGVPMPAGYAYAVTGNVTLYGKLTALYTVVFSTGHGTPAQGSLTLKAGSVLTAAQTAAPTGATGYEFTNWYLNPAGTGAPVGAGYVVTGNVTLYANWLGLYTLTFVTGVGAAPTPITVSEGASAVALPSPVYAGNGYEFDGWYEDAAFNAKANDPYLVTRSLALTAKWTAVYAARFETDKGVAPATRTARADAAPITLSAPAYAGDDYEFDGWYLSAAPDVLYAGAYKLEADASFTAKWTAVYEVTYDANGGNAQVSARVRADAEPLTLPQATRTGAYDFDGWYIGSDGPYLADRRYKAEGNVAFTARWTALYTIEYDVTDAQKGIVSPVSQKVRADAPALTLPTPMSYNPNRYAFEGWYTNVNFSPSERVPEGTYKVTRDTVLHANWAAVYALTLSSNGSEYEKRYVREDAGAEILPTPVRSGYAFDGWYANESWATPVNSPYKVTANTTLYAKWTAGYTLSFETDGGAAIEAVSVRADNNIVTLPLPAKLPLARWAFDGWYAQSAPGTLYASGTEYAVTADVTLRAKWTYVYSLTFESEFGSEPERGVRADANTVQLPDMFWANKRFLGWYTDSGRLSPAANPYTVTDNVTLYAKWTDAYTVQFVTALGNTPEPITRMPGDAPVELPRVQSGNPFDGWYEDAEYTTRAGGAGDLYQVTRSVTLYAKWLDAHIINYDTNGLGGAVPPTAGSSETPAFALPRPSQTGWVFDGWYTSNYPFPASDRVNQDAYRITLSLTLYAKWTYVVTYDMSGVSAKTQGIFSGSSAATETAVYLSSSALPAPEAVGDAFAFSGWYTDETKFSDPAYKVSTYADLTTGNIRLYAKWTYTITYVLNGVGGMGSTPNPEEISDGRTGELPSPEASSRVFGGWYILGDSEASGIVSSGIFPDEKRVTSYGQVSALGNAKLYAKWTYKIAYDRNGLGAALGLDDEETAVMNAAGALPSPSNAGWTFAGWYAEAAFTGAKLTNYSETSALGVAAVRLYAKWTYEVTFNLNGVTASNLPAEWTSKGGGNYTEAVTKGRSAALTSAITATGWTFRDWYRDNGTFADVVTNYSALTAGNVTLYAKWTYAVSFNAYGLVSVVPKEVVKGSEGTAGFEGLPEPVAANWVFAGWYALTSGELANASAGTFPAGKKREAYAEFKNNNYADLSSGGIALYAKWTFTVTYDARGVPTDAAGAAVHPAAVANVVKGQSYATLPTKADMSAMASGSLDGFNFGGWYAEYAPATNVYGGSAVTNFNTLTSGNVTLYAKWEFTLAFNLNGVSASAPAGGTRTVGDFGELPAPTNVTGGWTFGGWYKVNAADGAFNESHKVSDYGYIMTGGNYTVSGGTVYLYAKWTYEITYVLNGVTATGTLPQGWTAAGSNYKEAATKGFAGNLPTPTGAVGSEAWHFAGWYTQNGTSGAFVEGSKVTAYSALTGDVTLYAKWTYYITYEMHGAGSVTSPQEVTRGTAGAPSSPSAGGFTFVGWFRAYAAATNDFTDAVTSYPNGGDVTLHAKWTYTLTFSTNGVGTASPNPETVVMGKSGNLPDYAALGSPSAWTFGGWYRATAFSGDAVTTYGEITAGNVTLYAKWTYTVSFNAMGAAADPNGISNVKGASNTALPAVSASGWTFAGWYAAADFAAQITNLNQLTNGHATLYAKWTYTVTFDLNFGSAGVTTSGGSPAFAETQTNGKYTRTVTRGTAGALPWTTTKPTLSGYEFGGWYAQNAASANSWQWDGAATAFNSAGMNAGNITLYAKWTFTVTFNTMGETTRAQYTAFKGEGVTISASTAANYDFGGWYVLGSATETNLSAGLFDNASAVGAYSDLTSGNVTVYAKWTFTVKFNLNGHGTAIADKTIVKGYAAALPVPDAAGFSFDAWYHGEVSPANKIAAYTALNGRSGKVFTVTANWGYGVSFSVNGVSGATNNVNSETGNFTIMAGAGATGALPTVSASGWTFAGWYTDNGTFADPKTTYDQLSIGGGITLYAKWTYNVTFNLNGVSAAMAAVTKTKGATGSIDDPTGIAQGWTFDGWFTDNGTFASKKTNYDQLTTGDVTLHAKWTYAVSFNLNGVSATAPPSTGSGSIPDPTGIASGWTFAGWYSVNSATGAFNDANKVTNYSDSLAGKTLYAKWTYTVTFDLNGVSATMATVTKTKGEAGAIANPGGIPSGWTFAGWYSVNTSFTGQKTTYDQLTTGNVTLYARWTYTVTFNLNGVSATANTVTKTKGEAGSIANPTNIASGWTFAGWFSDNGTFTSQKTTYSDSLAGTTLHAKWTYTVSFDLNGVSATMSGVAKTKGETGSIDDPGSIPSTWTFAGWYTVNSTTGAFNDANKVTTYSDSLAGKTLYAKWTYAVTFNLNGVSATAPPAKVKGDSNTSIANPGGIPSVWTFAGWYSVNSATGAFSEGNKVTTYSDALGGTTLYAKWTYTVTFNLNGASANMSNVTKTKGEAGSIANPTGITSGWMFDGWFTDNSTFASQRTTYDQLTTGNVTLYAKWWFAATISTGDKHSLALGEDGWLYAWGYNDKGQLGLGNNTNRNTPTRVGTRKYKAISAGGHSLALGDDGYLYAWGGNASGQLGLGDTNDRSTPTRVGDRKYKAISAGNEHSLALDENGYLWSWGLNYYYQLGLGYGSSGSENIPMQVGTNKYKAIAAADNQSLALDENGYLWSWGWNAYGQLGLGHNQYPVVPPTQTAGTRKYKAIVAQTYHSLALDEDGYLWAFGGNNWGQLGLDDTNGRNTPTRVGDRKYKAVETGDEYSLALGEDGYLYAWGKNDLGQLGLNDTNQRNTPTRVGDRKYKAVAAKYKHSLAIGEDGYLYAWGDNSYGGLGLGDTNQRNAPVKITSS